jgi:uracil-DNA glycosylase
LPLGPRPILQIGARARILIASQAPGRRAHQSGVPFADRAGDTLCCWLGLDRAIFHDPEVVAILPIGLCYPGRGAGGDRPPRPECAPRWHERLRAVMPAVSLTLVLGRHAQAHYLGARCRPTLSATVAAFRGYLPGCFPLPHPSPRNTPWLVRHPWFERDVLPALRAEVARALR